MSVFRRAYGASPLHLAGHLGLFGVAGFALWRIFSGGDIAQVVAWYIGFALLQDLVLIPVYSLAGRALGRARLGNHVRIPAAISALLLLVFAPLIFGLGRRTYRVYSGHPVAGYLRNWLLISAGLFTASALVYGARRWRRRSRA